MGKLFAKKNKNPLTSQQLTDITRGMHHAASSTMSMVAQQYIYMLEQFFDKQDDGSLRAKMVRVDINDKHFMLVPLISLVAPKGLTLKEMNVEMSVRMEEADIKKATHDIDESDATRSSFKVNLAPKPKGDHEVTRRPSDIIDISLSFASNEPPEGVMRIIDQYTNLIDPIPVHTSDQKPNDFTPLADKATIEKIKRNRENNYNNSNK